VYRESICICVCMYTAERRTFVCGVFAFNISVFLKALQRPSGMKEAPKHKEHVHMIVCNDTLWVLIGLFSIHKCSLPVYANFMGEFQRTCRHYNGG